MTAQRFREELLQRKTGDQIADLALQYATKPTNFAPVTVPVPGMPGAKLTYHVMKGYISADDYPIPVDAVTADELARRWGMHLPTGKMIDQITQESSRTGGLIKVTPLSASGYSSGGVRLTPEEIVRGHISDPRLIDKHNELVQQYIKEKGVPAESIMIGDQKVLIAPEPGKEGYTHFKGFLKEIKRDANGKPILSFYQSGLSASPHPSKGHFEYPLKAKLIKDEMTLTLPNGESKSLTFAQAVNIPQIAPTITNAPISTYSASSPAPKDKGKDKKYDYSSKEDSKSKVTDLPSKKDDDEKDKKSDTESKGLWDEIKEKASEAWKATKSFVGNVFSQAEEFELMAISEYEKTKIAKIAMEKRILNKKASLRRR